MSTPEPSRFSEDSANDGPLPHEQFLDVHGEWKGVPGAWKSAVAFSVVPSILLAIARLAEWKFIVGVLVVGFFFGRAVWEITHGGPVAIPKGGGYIGPNKKAIQYLYFAVVGSVYFYLLSGLLLRL
jgi:hypothetical protein